jgi:glutamate-1-semialdehyde 2,1-aminomutase
MKNAIPGGLQHNLGSSEPFALTYSKARGDKVYDIDGNEYVDYLLDGGPIILGHHFEPLDAECGQAHFRAGPGGRADA